METLLQTNTAKYYETVQIQTASKQKAVCMLHEKCVLFIVAALDIPKKRPEYVARSQNILSQLQRSLVCKDMVSQSLFLLYDYCYVILDHAQDDDLNNAGKIMAILRDTFKYLVRHPQ